MTLMKFDVTACCVAMALALTLPTAAFAARYNFSCVHSSKTEAEERSCTKKILNSNKPTSEKADWLKSRADRFRKEGKCARAEADLDLAWSLLPPSEKTARYLIWTARGINQKECFGNVDEAIKRYEEAARESPGENGAYHNLGLAHQFKEDWPASVASFGKALDAFKAYLATRAGHETPFEKRQNLEQLSKIHNARGTTYTLMNELDLAMAEFDESIKLAPDFNAAYGNRGLVWRLKGDLARSLADLDHSVALFDSDIMRAFRVDTYRYLGQLERAMAEANVILARRPDLAPTLVSRGLVYERMGNPRAAERDFLEALKTPEHRYDRVTEAQKTARARLAALKAGVDLPTIPPAPSKVANATTIPTSAVAVPSVKPTTTQGRRIALIIGNSAYRSVAPLTNPQRDSAAVATTLRNIGFEVLSVTTDGTRDMIDAALRGFADEAERAEWALVYYAGHGIEVNGTNYLIPVDAKLAADRDVQFEAVPLDRVMAAVEGAKKLRLIVLDACRDNPFAALMRRTAAPEASTASTAGGTVGSRSMGRGLASVPANSARQATLVVYAAKHGQVALDGEGANSPFAIAFVQRIATPGVEINKIFRLVRDDVMELTAGRQEPFTYGSLPGREDFYFVTGR